MAYVITFMVIVSFLVLFVIIKKIREKSLSTYSLISLFSGFITLLDILVLAQGLIGAGMGQFQIVGLLPASIQFTMIFLIIPIGLLVSLIFGIIGRKRKLSSGDQITDNTPIWLFVFILVLVGFLFALPVLPFLFL